MLTKSRMWLLKAENTRAVIDSLERDIEILKTDLGNLKRQEEFERTKYNQEYKSELESRRNFAPEVILAVHPNREATGEWLRWRNHWEKASRLAPLKGLGSFAFDMMRAANFKAWNGRNPNPYLP